MVEVHLTLGSIVVIEPADRYNPDEGPVRIRVTGVRAVAHPSMQNDWVWVEGARVSDGSVSDVLMSALVRASVFSLAGEPVR